MTPLEPVTLHTERLVLRSSSPELAAKLLAYLERNRAHFAASGPQSSEPLDLARCQAVLAGDQRTSEAGGGIRLYLFERDAPEIIGNVSFTNIVRGVFRACHLGYRLDERHQGRGLMREALERSIRYAFEDLDLHRIMANYRPENERSGRLLRRLGFVVEGYARDYLFLDGAWRDHVLTSLVREEKAQ